MVRPALEVPDAVALELGLERGGTAPAGVLPPLVGQDLARHPVVRDPARQRFQHQAALLLMRQRETHEITRVIVQERRHVQPLVLPEQEREDVRLPQLVRLGPLEPRELRPRLGPRARLRPRQPLLMQHPPHRGRRRAEPEVTSQHIPDPPAPRRRIRSLRRHDRRRPRRSRTARPPQARSRRRQQARFPARAVFAAPLQHRRVRHPEPTRDLARVQPVVHHRSRRRQAHLARPRTMRSTTRAAAPTVPTCLSLAGHLCSPRRLSRQAQSRSRC